MSKVIIELNSAGVGSLLKGAELQEFCRKKAEAIADRATGQWEVETGVGKYRSFASVSTKDRATYSENLRSNTLLKALGGG